jgi:hypothetical protein
VRAAAIFGGSLLVALLTVGCGNDSGGVVEGLKRLGAVPAPLHLAPLDPSDPAQAAVIQWHRALVERDFAAYAEVDIHPVDATEASRRMWFETLADSGIPRQIAVNDGTGRFDDVSGIPAADRKLLAALRLFTVVGCASPGDGNPEVRRVAEISVREVAGQWRVGGASFGPPNAYSDGTCPL